MIKFTKEEISLCKQVANTGERRALRFGDFWFYSEPGSEQRIHVVSGKEAVVSLMEQQILDCFPLWTISDCLEFLESKGWQVLGITWQEVAIKIMPFTARMSDPGKGDYAVVMQSPEKRSARMFKGTTRLCACLKAVLAVLEEGK